MENKGQGGIFKFNLLDLYPSLEEKLKNVVIFLDTDLGMGITNLTGYYNGNKIMDHRIEFDTTEPVEGAHFDRCRCCGYP